MSWENNSKNRRKPSKTRNPFQHFCYDFVKVTGALPALLWMRPKRYYPFGKPNTRGALLVSSNHCSMVDPIVVQLAFPLRRLHSLATKDLFSSKAKSAFFHQMHCIVADKENFSLSSFHEVVSRLQDGKMVVIFPEGTVNREGADALLAFKSGAVLMAHKAGAPILPMYIVKREKWYHRQHIVLGTPIDVVDMLGKMPTMQDLTRVSDLLREKEIELREYFASSHSLKR